MEITGINPAGLVATFGILGFFESIVKLVLVLYMLYLGTRAVNALERIADK